MENSPAKNPKPDRSNWTIEVLSFAEAKEKEIRYWRTLTGAERLRMLVELRIIWTDQDDPRLKRTFELVEVA